MGIFPFKLSTVEERLELLFSLHAFIALVFGTTSIVYPRIYYFFFVPDWSVYSIDVSWSPVFSVITRCYGSLILGQSWITFSARKNSNLKIKKALVQAYFIIFLLTFVSLLTAQLKENFHFLNWLNVLCFFCLCTFYGYFAVVDRKVFQASKCTPAAILDQESLMPVPLPI